jgi:hypothetical protein
VLAAGPYQDFVLLYHVSCCSKVVVGCKEYLGVQTRNSQTGSSLGDSVYEDGIFGARRKLWKGTKIFHTHKWWNCLIFLVTGCLKCSYIYTTNARPQKLAPAATRKNVFWLSVYSRSICGPDISELVSFLTCKQSSGASIGFPANSFPPTRNGRYITFLHVEKVTFKYLLWDKTCEERMYLYSQVYFERISILQNPTTERLKIIIF